MKEEMEKAKDILLEKLQDAELVLVGIGEEFGEKMENIEADLRFSDCFNIVKERKELHWMLPYLKKLWEDSCIKEKTAKAYGVLEGLLKDKNYFIVSTRTDDYIYKTKLLSEKIVTPCGGYRFCQCEDGCGNRLYEADGQLPQKIYEYLAASFSAGQCGVEEKMGDWEGLQPPQCPDCGKYLVFNNIEARNYLEKGYLDQWNQYMKWLQGTVNRRLCVLELGVGMQYPTVIRWPFEKVVFFNRKSNIFRIHSKLYQLTEEIKDRGYRVKERPMDFLTL